MADNNRDTHTHVVEKREGGGNAGIVIAIIALIVVFFLFFAFGGAFTGGRGANDAVVPVPDQIDVNVQNP